MSETQGHSEARVWTCDGCSSWTNESVTYEQLLSEWGWEEESEDDKGVFCPACQ